MWCRGTQKTLPPRFGTSSTSTLFGQFKVLTPGKHICLIDVSVNVLGLKRNCNFVTNWFWQVKNIEKYSSHILTLQLCCVFVCVRLFSIQMWRFSLLQLHYVCKKTTVNLISEVKFVHPVSPGGKWFLDVLSFLRREFFDELTYARCVHGVSLGRSPQQKTHEQKYSKHQNTQLLILLILLTLLILIIIINIIIIIFIN